MNWSDEQLTIFEAFETKSTNLMVNASPGSGKTTVAKEIWTRAKDISTLYLAFNRNIVNEAISKLPTKKGSSINTFNGLGTSICRTYLNEPKLNKNKIYQYIREFEQPFPERKREEYTYALAQLVQSAKSNLSIEAMENSPSALEELIEYYDLDTYDDIVQHAMIVIRNSNKDTQVIDFQDQLLFPVLYDLTMPHYDLIIVDEAQDVNYIQRESLRKLQERNPDVRFIFVGDSRQAIYAFRGALADSMAVLGEEFSCTQLPLTITRRCAVNIVREAQRVWPDDINAAPDAIDGIVRKCESYNTVDKRLRPIERDYYDVIECEIFTADAMVLCRTNAPLVSYAYQLLRCGIPCQIRGRDIGEGLVRYIKKADCFYVDELIEYMEKDVQYELTKAKGKYTDKVQRLLDKQETIQVFCDACASLYTSKLIEHITALFEHGKGVLLSTVHKAKGLEAEKVYILAADLMPHPLAEKDWELEQEANIQYVAITRAKNELVYM